MFVCDKRGNRAARVEAFIAARISTARFTTRDMSGSITTDGSRGDNVVTSVNVHQILANGNSKKGISVEDISREVYRVLHRLAGQWSDIHDARALTLRPINGAMTSQVYECHWPREDAQNTRKVIVRFYGDNADILFKRDDEILTFERMSQCGQGPRLLGRFPRGRVEEFLNARTLSALDLRNPEISLRIAAKLRQFHDLDMPWPSQPLLWKRLRDWLKKALELSPKQGQEEFQLHSLENEISELEQRISKPGQRVAFCHNDLQYGNIMINENDGSLTIIDYEYASYNPISFDIGNHFCEMAANYHSSTPHLLDFSKYPAFDERYRFVEAYLKGTGESPSTTEILTLVEEVEAYTLASHLHWGLWGIISATLSEIDFNYMAYARQRFKQYYDSKPSIC